MSEREELARVTEGRVWSDFCSRLEDAGDALLAGAPDDPFDRAEGLRYLGRLTHHFLRSVLDESDPAQAVLSVLSPKIGLDNPDYLYTGARLSPRFEYRLRGELGDAHMLGIGVFSGGLGTPTGLVRDAYLTSAELQRDAEGRFEVALGREPREGNWLPLGEASNGLQIRQTLLRRGSERPARFELERVDRGEPPAPLEPRDLARALDRVALMVNGVVRQFQGWTESFRAHPFEIRPLDPALMSFAQGDPNTAYHYGYWELADDEVFLIELEPPADFDYWNLQIGNHWLESLDFLHRRTHVNHATAQSEPDGSVRIAVSARDPGVPNWLDTAGHRRGALALRWVGARPEPATPRCSVVQHQALR